MSSIANLQRLPASAVSKLLLAEQEAATNPSIAVVDVRDDDRIGGHIKGSIHAPSATLDAKMPTLVRQLHDKETVIFHCALSQQRGPGAALKYLRERERMFPSRKKTGDDEKAEAAKRENKKESEPAVEQKVYVLDRGFVGWQEVYAGDERLTEAYRKELWEDGYSG